MNAASSSDALFDAPVDFGVSGEASLDSLYASDGLYSYDAVVESVSEDGEMMSALYQEAYQCRQNLVSCINLLLVGDILLALLIGCLCASILSRFLRS